MSSYGSQLLILFLCIYFSSSKSRYTFSELQNIPFTASDFRGTKFM